MSDLESPGLPGLSNTTVKTDWNKCALCRKLHLKSCSVQQNQSVVMLVLVRDTAYAD